MTDTAEYAEITSAAELREYVGEPMPQTEAEERPRLHERDKEWLAASPFCLIATSDAEGNCDVSPRGDPVGFTHVVDDYTVAIPDRPGNRRLDGFMNIMSNPHAGLIYLLPGRTETLRINGRARLLRAAPYFDQMVVKGHRPRLALVVEIDTVFLHCSKAFMRSKLWKPETWDPDAVPPHARLVKDVLGRTETLEELADRDARANDVQTL